MKALPLALCAAFLVAALSTAVRADCGSDLKAIDQRLAPQRGQAPDIETQRRLDMARRLQAQHNETGCQTMTLSVQRSLNGQNTTRPPGALRLPSERPLGSR